MKWSFPYQNEKETAGSVAALKRTVGLARAFNDPEWDPELMPLRASLRSENAEVPESLHGAMNRFENRLRRDPERKRHLETCEERLQQAFATDVEAHFERVTGHRLEDFPVLQGSRSCAATPEVPPRALPTGRRHRRVVHRPRPRSDVRQPLARTRMGSGVLAAIMLLFVLTPGSYERDPLSDALGEAVASESVLFGSLGQTSRGAMDPGLEERKAKVRAALDLIDRARTSILGFHTGYEPDALKQAANLIDSAAWTTSAVEPGTAELYRLRDEIRKILADEGYGTELRPTGPPLP